MGFHRNKGSGFSIVQVLVATALVGFLAAAVTTLITNAQRGQKTVQQGTDFEILKQNLLMVFNSPICKDAFQVGGANAAIALPFGKSWTSLGPGDEMLSAPLPVERIRLGALTLAQQGQNLGGGLMLEKLEIVSAQYLGEKVIPPAVLPHKIFAAVVNFEARKSAGSLGGLVLKPSQPMGVRLIVNPNSSPAGQIEYCEPPGGLAGLPVVPLSPLAAEKALLGYAAWPDYLRCATGGSSTKRAYFHLAIMDYDSTANPCSGTKHCAVYYNVGGSSGNSSFVIYAKGDGPGRTAGKRMKYQGGDAATCAAQLPLNSELVQ